MALELGGVFTRVGFRYDDTGKNRYERDVRELRSDSRRDIETDARLDVDRTGFNQWDRATSTAGREADHLDRKTGKLRGGMLALGKGVAVAGAAIGTGLVFGVRKAWQEFEEAAKVGAQTEAVIKSTGGAAKVTAGDVASLSQAISNKSAIDDELIQKGANVLLTFKQIRNETGAGNDIFNQATQSITDMSVALDKDLNSSAIMVGKALNDPIKGVTALGRAGVQFTEQQKEQIAAMVESGRTLDAQKIILRELQTQFAGSAEAQARPLDRAKVAVNNLFEAVGTALAPAIEGAASAFADFVGALTTGEGAAGQVTDTLRRLAGGARDLAGFIGTAFTTIRDAFTGGNDDATTWAATVIDTARRVGLFFRDLWTDFKQIFGDMGEDLETIGKAFLVFERVIWSVISAVVKTILPGLRQAIVGLANVVRGVVRVIAGILRGDFRAVWDGVKQIVRGALNAVIGIIRVLTAPFRTAIMAVARPIGNVLGDAWRGLRSVVRGVVDAITGFVRGMQRTVGNVVSFILRRFADVFDLASRLPFVGDKFDGLAANARNLADKIDRIGERARQAKTDLLSIPEQIDIVVNYNAGKIPTLKQPGQLRARGGKAGPGQGGPAVVWGEGGKTEWWISQEGDRRQNIAWGVEALRELTGRNVVFAAAGRRSGSKRGGRRAPVFKKATRAVRGINRREAGFSILEERIANWEDSYATLERTYALDDSDLLIEQEDGSMVVDQAALNNRLADLDLLMDLRRKITEELKKYKAKIVSAVKSYLKAIKTLRKALKAVTGSGKKSADQRDAYRVLIEDYERRVTELGGTGALGGKITGGLHHEVMGDANDSGLDLADLALERSAVAGTTGEAAPVDTAAGGDTGTAPPSAEDVAREAMAQFAAFQAARADLFSSQGANFMAAGGRLEGEGPQAAGLRFFGAFGGAAGSGGGGTTINQTFNFGGGPGDPLTFAQSVDHEMKAAIG